MSMEPKMEEEENAQEESESKISHNKSRRIKKSPKPNKSLSDPPNLIKKKSVASELCLMPQFGVFESQMQKQSRLEKFWLVQIDNYYRSELGPSEKELLDTIIEEDVPSLQQILNDYKQVLPTQNLPFEELFRYIQLVRECRSGSQLMLLTNEGKQYLGVFTSNGQLERIAQMSEQEAFLVAQRQKFMTELKSREDQYNMENGLDCHLSEISAQVAFMLYLMHKSKDKINKTLTQLRRRITEEPLVDSKAADNVRDRYVACLIRKNLAMALLNTEIDYLNYYATLDSIQQHGAEPETRAINDKKEFEEYMKRKKNKKARKNPKSVLKTACGGCLSSYFEQYNPFFYCPDCHVRFHKYCYTSIKDGLCETCYHRKEPVLKGRAVQCQLCPNRGLLSVPLKSVKEGVSVHVFCMLINGLWRFQNGNLQFHSNSFMNPNSHDDLCSICNSAVYTYSCSKCQKKAHPLCAYLQGWNIEIPQEGGVTLQCCHGAELQKNSYRRKFILNYKKILFKSERDR